jgi:hypothetical protein
MDVLATTTGRLVMSDGASHLLLVTQSGGPVSDVPAVVSVGLTAKADISISVES